VAAWLAPCTLATSHSIAVTSTLAGTLFTNARMLVMLQTRSAGNPGRINAVPPGERDRPNERKLHVVSPPTNATTLPVLRLGSFADSLS